MPARRKRSSGQEPTPSVAPKRSRSSVAAAEAFDEKRCIAWFREYTTADNRELLGPEGMERFCQDIGVEPENVVMLVIAFNLDAETMGYFKEAEWIKGMRKIKCDSADKVRAKRKQLESTLNNEHTFKEIHRYAFDFCREKTQRSLDMSLAREMQRLLLGPRWSLFTHLDKFLESSNYRVMNRDQWCSILEFSRTVSLSLDDYDEDGAWPVMLDDFVANQKQARSEASTPSDL